MHSRTKHMEIDLFFVIEKVLARQLDVVHILGPDQLADVLSKPLGYTKFLKLKHKFKVTHSP